MKRFSLLSVHAALLTLAAASVAVAQTPDDPAARSRSEPGLLVYSNIAAYNWGPIVEAFRARYPWIKVEALDLGPAEAFERYYSESSVKRRTADVIAVAAPDSWLRFLDRDGIRRYKSREDAALPAWSKPFDGLYTISTDPVVLVYNKLLLKPEQRPAKLDELATLVAKNSAPYRRRLTTYDATSHPFAYALHWAYVNQRGDQAWKTLGVLGPQTLPEGGGATMVEKITAGEYVGAYFASSVTFLRRMKEEGRERVLDWSLIEDGTPLMVRGVAITKAATSEGSARLFLDFVLSREGQIAVGRGGLTPYRPDVTPKDVPFLTYEGIRQKIGEKNVIIVGYDRKMVDDQQRFLARWKATYGLKH